MGSTDGWVGGVFLRKQRVTGLLLGFSPILENPFLDREGGK